MRGPVLSVTRVQFDFKLTSVRIGAYGITPVTKDYFHLRRTAYNEALISLVKPIQGPQDIELALELKLYNGGLYGGSIKTILFVYVSQYSF
jgi:fibulin 1/2